MHTGYISFCDKLGLNIKSHEVKEKIVNDLQNRFGVKIIQRHHDRLESIQTLGRLQKNPHMVCLKTNGNPYFLYLTRCQYVNQCIFIDKKIQSGYFVPRMIISKFRFDDDLFDDTLIDGEMITLDGKWLFLVHDMVVFKGRRLDQENTVKRIQMVHDILSSQYKPDSSDICHIQVKKYVTYDKLRELVEDFMPTLPYTCRGLYFKPLYLKFIDVLFNFDESLIIKVERIKYQAKNDTFHETIESVEKKEIEVEKKIEKEKEKETEKKEDKADLTSMLIEKTHQVDIYMVYDPETKKCVGNAAIPTLILSRKMQDLFKTTQLHAKVSISCKFHEKFQKWYPILPETVE